LPRTRSGHISRLLNSASIIVPALIACLPAAGAPPTEAPTAKISPQLSAMAARFEEPLIATAPVSEAENAALLAALKAHEGRATPDDFTAIRSFLSDYPASGWRIALLTNLGFSYYSYGYFSKAIEAWDQAFQNGRSLTEPHARALADRALGELMRMHARLGHADRLAALFEDIGDRHVSGPATETLTGAKEGLWMMRHEPGVAYLCGPMALKNLLLAQGAGRDEVRFIEDIRSGPNGVILALVALFRPEALKDLLQAIQAAAKFIPAG
jgi:tetratricopeptide (TPR) repeat protein